LSSLQGTKECPQTGDSFFDNRFELDGEDDFIIVSVRMYKFFMAHGKDGLDAKALYDHLVFASRVQGTKSIKANISYIKNGLGWGIVKIKKAKAFLKAAGLIEYSQNQDDSGQFQGQKILIKSRWDAGALQAWIDKKSHQKDEELTDGIETVPPVEKPETIEDEESINTPDIGPLKEETLNSRWYGLPTTGSTVPPVSRHNYKGSYKKEISPPEEKTAVVENSPPPPASSPPTAGFSLPQVKEEMIHMVKTRTKDSMFYFTPLENNLMSECYNKYGPEWVLKRFESYMKSKTSSQIDRFHSTDFPKVLRRAAEKSFKQAAPADPMRPKRHECPVCKKSWSASSTLSSCPGCGLELAYFNDPEEIEAHKQWFEEFQEKRNKKATG